MSDVVVTVPQGFWEEWIAEGDAVGEPWSGEEWDFFLGGYPPKVLPGERVYIVCRRRLRGYAPLVRLEPKALRFRPGPTGYALIRRGGAIAVTIPGEIPGFRGFRYRWWDRSIEIPFPEWKTA